MRAIAPAASVSAALQDVVRRPDHFALLTLQQEEQGLASGRLAFMTDFGPVVRPIEPCPLERIGEIAAQIVRAGRPPSLLVHAKSSELYEALSCAAETAFGAMRPNERGAIEAFVDLEETAPDAVEEAFAVFMQSRREFEDVESMLWWSVAPAPERPFVSGEILRAAVEAERGKTVVRFRDADGRDAGLHGEFSHGLTDVAVDEVLRFEGVVRDAIFGTMPSKSGDVTVQTLTFLVPTAFARALSDAKLPRHCGVTSLEAVGEAA